MTTNHIERMFLDFERKVVDPDITEENRVALYGAFVAGVLCFFTEQYVRAGDLGAFATFVGEIDTELEIFGQRLREAGESYPPAPARA
jgi:hypothetical protein